MAQDFPTTARTKLDSGYSLYNGSRSGPFAYGQSGGTTSGIEPRTCSSISEYSRDICLSDNAVGHPDATVLTMRLIQKIIKDKSIKR